MIDQGENLPVQANTSKTGSSLPPEQVAAEAEAAEIVVSDIMPPGFATDVSSSVNTAPDKGIESERAELRLASGLDLLRAANGRMCSFIDAIANPDLRAKRGEITEQEAETSKTLWAELRDSGIDGTEAAVNFRNQQNIEGSMYIQQGADNVRFRWMGAAAAQDVYLNGTQTYFGCNQDSSVEVNRVNDTSSSGLRQQSDDLLRRQEAAIDSRSMRRYEADLERYESRSQVIGRMIGGLFGRTYSPPDKPEPASVENPSTSAEDLQMSPERHEELISAVETTVRVLTAGAEALEKRYADLLENG